MFDVLMPQRRPFGDRQAEVSIFLLRKVIALLRLGSIVRLVKLHGRFGAAMPRVRVIQQVRRAL